MAYIGPEPAESFTSFATQEFSTSATTSYTLDHAVANENEIALFVNNVRQQPGSGKAYTASSTTLTLSAATASTDTMYCVFLGRALQTVTPATNSINNAMLSSTAAIATTKLGAGAVLQVVSAENSTGVDSTSATFADTGLTANITPSSTSNKILVIANHTNTRANGSTQIGLKLFRDSTEIRQSRYLADTNDSTRNHISVTIVELDSPSSSSQITYKTQFNNEQASGTTTVQQGSASGPSTITLMEIAG